MVQVENLEKHVASPNGPLTILDSVSFKISIGESVAIVGPSGSGKSTLLGLLAGLDLPTSGRVVVNDQELNKLDEDKRARIRAELVGFVFQSFHLLPNLTALENIVLPLELHADDMAQSKGKEIIQLVGLEHRAKHYPHQLSGGEQQRVAIARAFVTKPKLLFADEPTGNLDQITGEQIIELLFKLNSEQHTTLVMVTHDSALARRCDRHISLDHGRVLSDA